MHHRDRSFNLDQMKQTAINFHIDDLSRKSSAPPIFGHGAAMAAASSSNQCHHCKASDHFKRDYPKLAQKNRSNRGKKKGKKAKVAILRPSGVPTTRPPPTVIHNVTGRRSSNSWLRNLALLRSSEQRFVIIGSALLAQTLQPEPQPEPQTFGFSFSAVRASWVEATASTATLASAPTQSACKPAAPATPALQSGPAPPQSPQRNGGIPEGVFGALVETTIALSAAGFLL